MTASNRSQIDWLTDAGATASTANETTREPALHANSCACTLCRGFAATSITGTPPNSSTSEIATRPGTLSQMADYLKTDFWADWDISHRNFNLSTSGSHAKNGILAYSTGNSNQETDNLTSARVTLVNEAFKLFEAILGINFKETNSDDADLFFTNSDEGAYTQATLSGSTTDSATINISSNWQQGSGAFGDYTFQTILHEIGHALGLGHQGLYNTSGHYSSDADFTNDSWQSSIMSYFSQADNTSIDASYAFLSTPMVVDWIALDKIYSNQGYGISNAFTGDTTYGFNTNIQPSTSRIFHELKILIPSTAYTLVDGGGLDTVDFSGFSSNQLIDLRPSDASNTQVYASNIAGQTGNLTIAPGSIIEAAIGGSGSDTFRGNHENNTLDGGDGTDTVLFDGSPDDYQISLTDGQLQVKDLRSDHQDGTDTLINIESINFNGEIFSRADLINQLDSTAPTIQLSTSRSSLRTDQTATINFSLSEASADFSQNDVSLTGGSLSNWSAASPTSYAATFTPAHEGNSSSGISVKSGTFSDSAGNLNRDGADSNNALSIKIKETQPASFVIKGMPRTGRTLHARRTDRGSKSNGSFHHAWQITSKRQGWNTVNVGNTFMIKDQHAGSSVRLLTTYSTPQGIQEVPSASRNIPHAPLKLTTSSFRNRTLILHWEGKLGPANPTTRRFRVTSRGQEIPIRSTRVRPGRDSITLKLARSMAPSSELHVSYKDRKGDQITGAIENASGLDMKSFRTMVVGHSKAERLSAIAENIAQRNRHRSSRPESLFDPRETSQQPSSRLLDGEPLAFQSDHQTDASFALIRHADITAGLDPANDLMSGLLQGNRSNDGTSDGIPEALLC